MSPEAQFVHYYVIPAVLSCAIAQSLILHWEKDVTPKSPIKTKACMALISLLPGINIILLIGVTLFTFFYVYDKLDK